MEKSSFFNSVLDQNGNPDRPYLAEDFARYFSAVIGNGIFPNPSNNLQAISNNNMTITIKQGKAWINGYFYYNTDDLILPIEVADGVLNRIDRIVLRLDFINREIKAKVKKGTFASSPTAPTLQRDADAYELALADIAVNKGTISITQGSITDKRLDNSLCGIVHGVVDQVDITTLFNQYTVGFQQKELQFEQEFQTWFATIQGQLSGDVAGNLSNQILNLAGAGRTTETVKGNADAIKTLTTQMGEMKTEIINLGADKANKADLNTKVNNTDYSKLNVYIPTITGTSTAYLGSVANGQTAYVDGQLFTIIPNVDCGNSPTFNFNNIGALTIVKQDGSAVSAGDIKAGKPLSLVRVGSSFFIRNGSNPFKFKFVQQDMNKSFRLINYDDNYSYYYNRDNFKVYKYDNKTGAQVKVSTALTFSTRPFYADDTSIYYINIDGLTIGNFIIKKINWSGGVVTSSPQYNLKNTLTSTLNYGMSLDLNEGKIYMIANMYTTPSLISFDINLINTTLTYLNVNYAGELSAINKNGVLLGWSSLSGDVLLDKIPVNMYSPLDAVNLGYLYKL